MPVPSIRRACWKRRALVLLCALVLAACAGADRQGPRNAAMTTGENTPAPYGYVAFCARNPQDCLPEVSASAETVLTRQKWVELNTVNKAVNVSVEPLTDAELYRSYEFWAYPASGPDARGDCEDYVLLKRKMLIEKGWPARALLISVALENNGQAHALLVAVTDRGDYVLDNQTDVILPWAQTPYQWEKRQSAADPTRWVSLHDDLENQSATAATRRVPRRGRTHRRQGD